jgi:hypothetical protein
MGRNSFLPMYFFFVVFVFVCIELGGSTSSTYYRMTGSVFRSVCFLLSLFLFFLCVMGHRFINSESRDS